MWRFQNQSMSGTRVTKPITWKCRACLKPVSKNNFVNIFQPWYATGAGKSIIAQDLAQLASIKISEDDELQILCEKCCLTLTKAWQFIHTVRECDKIIQENKKPIEGEETWPKPIQVDEHIKNSSVFGKAMEVDIKQEILSDDDVNEDEVEDGYKSDMSIKIEPEEMVTPKIKVTVNGTIRYDEMDTNSSITTNGSENVLNEEFLDGTIKEEPHSEDDLFKSDLPTECQLCAKPFSSISGLKPEVAHCWAQASPKERHNSRSRADCIQCYMYNDAHVIAHHSYKSVKRKSRKAATQRKEPNKHACASCRRSFSTQTDLMVHETCHNKTVCFSCKKNFETFGQLLKHRISCEAVADKEVAKPKMLQDVLRPLPELVIEPIQGKAMRNNTDITLKCTLCTETFSDTYYMKIHHEIHHQREGNNSAEAKSDKTKHSVSMNVEKMETDALQHMFEQTETNETERDNVLSDGKEQREINSEVSENTEINEKITNNNEISEAVDKIEQNYNSDNNTECEEIATSNEEDISERIVHEEASVLQENSGIVVNSEESVNIEEEKSEARTSETSSNQEVDCTLAMLGLETKDDTKSSEVIESKDNEVIDTHLVNRDPEPIQDANITADTEMFAQEDDCGHLNMPELDMIHQANSTEDTNEEGENLVTIVDTKPPEVASGKDPATKPIEELSGKDPANDFENSVHAEPETISTEENNEVVPREALDIHTPETKDTEMIETNIQEGCEQSEPEVTKTTEVLERNEQPEFVSKNVLHPEMDTIMELIDTKSAEDNDNKLETDTVIANEMNELGR